MILNLYGPSGTGKTTFIKALLKSNNTSKFYLNKTKENFEEDLNKKISISLLPIPIFRGTVKDFLNIFSISIDTLLNLNFELRKLSNTVFHEIENEIILNKVAMRNVETFSAGEMRRLFILKSLLVDSNIIIIDEPFANSDRELWNVIANAITTKSKAILLSHKPIKDNFSNKIDLLSFDIKETNKFFL